MGLRSFLVAATLGRQRPQRLGRVVVHELRSERRLAVGEEAAAERGVRREAAGERRARALVHVFGERREERAHQKVDQPRLAADRRGHHRARVERASRDVHLTIHQTFSEGSLEENGKDYSRVRFLETSRGCWKSFTKTRGCHPIVGLDRLDPAVVVGLAQT